MADTIWVALRAIKIRRKCIFDDICIVQGFMLWVTRSFAASKGHNADTLVKVFTMIQELLESLLSHASKFHQLFELFCCCHKQNQESVADTYEVDMLDELVPAFLLRVWWWPVEFAKDHYLQYLLQKMITFGLQFSFVSLESSLSII